MGNRKFSKAGARRRFCGALAPALGGVFIISAILKALDLTAFAAIVSYFGIIRTPIWVKSIAVAIIALEAGLGWMLLQRLAVRRIALPAVFALLVAFTGILAWAWVFRDLENCGCFGKYLRMTPGESILKNLALLGMALGAWRAGPHASGGRGECGLEERATSCGGSARAGGSPAWRKIAVAILGTASVVGLALATGGAGSGSPSGKMGAESFGAKAGGVFAAYSVDWQGRTLALGEGVRLIALLSDSCLHCGEDVEALNRIFAMPELPPVAGLVLGEQETLEQFRADYGPEFPTKLIPVLEFFELVGDVPPRVYLTRDGVEIRHWDENIPDVDEIVQAVAMIPAER